MIKKRPIWFGIDPGNSGSIALYSTRQGVDWIQLNETPQDISDWLSQRIADNEVMGAVLEQVHSMPKQGVSSSFKFGVSFGFCQGLLIAHKIPFAMVTPQKWQQAMKCLTKGDKNVSKQAAQRLFPSIKVTHSTADALLLARFAATLSIFSEGSP